VTANLLKQTFEWSAEQSTMPGPKDHIYRILNDGRTTVVLIIVNLFVTCAVVWASRTTVLSDTWSYLGLAEGLLHGEFSMWWSLDTDHPDTFRTPGYPLFVAMCITLFGHWKATLVVQFLLYWLALVMTLVVIERLDPRRIARNLFLLLLVPMVNVPYYIGQLYTEIPVLAAITLTLVLITRPGARKWYDPVLLGLLFGFIYQCKPIFLLFPFGFILLSIWFDRSRPNMISNAILFVTFTATVLPYAFWNLSNHGVFKATPLEGAGSYMHIGYWGGKMPGYSDRFYLQNFMGDELVRFTPQDSIPGHIRQYEREWLAFKQELAPLMTAKDSAMLAALPLLPYPAEPTYNTSYTLARERLLFNSTMQHYLEDPLYVLTYKSYSAIRLWVIGIQRGDLQAASKAGRLQMIYATASTGLIFLLCLLVIPWAYRAGVLALSSTWPFVAYLIYFGIMHVPFTIQARYTTSVRFVLLTLLALSIGRLLWGGGPAARTEPHSELA
jgi:hypothetical protein